MLDSQNNPPSLHSEVRIEPTVKSIPRYWLWLTSATGLVLVLIMGGLYWNSQRELQKAKDQMKQLQDSQIAKVAKSVASPDENKELVEKVGKLIILPANEEPTVATVSDLDKLKGQPFFAKAQIWDKVLIYSQAKKAVLYRPSTNEVIELAPLLDDANTPNAPTAGPIR